jgi:hypothetical protein
MACCVLVAAVFGAALRKFSRRGGRESPVAAAQWSPVMVGNERIDSPVSSAKEQI